MATAQVAQAALAYQEAAQRINKLSASEALSEGEASELASLRTEADGLHKRWIDLQREAIEAAPTGGEATELRHLYGRARLAAYVKGGATEGAEAELNAALGLPTDGSPTVPLGLLFGLREARADAVTDTSAYGGGINEQQWLPRLFSPEIESSLGILTVNVSTGRAEVPLTTAGVEPEQVAESMQQDSDALTVQTVSLRPKRMAAGVAFTMEAAASAAGLEGAIRRDLADALRHKICGEILSGSGSGAQVRGLLTALPAPQTAPSTVATYDDIASLSVDSVDALHCNDERDVSCLLNAETYRFAGSVFSEHGLDTGPESGLESLRRRSASVKATAYLPATASNVSVAILHGGGAMAMGRGDSLLASWQGVTLIYDDVTRANRGEVAIRANMLWDFYGAARPQAYRRKHLKIS